MISLADVPGRLAALLEPNRRGRSYAVTVLAAVEPGRVETLRAVLHGFGPGGESPLARLPYVHFGRWVVVDELKTGWAGVPHPLPRVGAPYLAFTADVTAPDDSYALPGDFFRDVGRLMGPAAVAVWENCRGFPGDDPDAIAAFLAARRVDAVLYYAAFPDATVAQIRCALALRREVAAFVQAQQHVSAAGLLRSRYLETSRTWPRST